VSRPFGWALLLVGMVFTGCGREGLPGSAGTLAPGFQAATLEGDTVSLASLRGAPVLLNLWATWCHPCRKETPFLQDVHERYAPRGLQVVGVTTDTRAAVADVHAFVEEFGVTYRVLHDPDGRSLDLFSAIGLPATYLIGADGVILWAKVGPVDEADEAFEEALDAAVRGSEARADAP
jgi:cytochrome c biogenesis protein CcmG/thiol:disulfide interchange protein DsbE